MSSGYPAQNFYQMRNQPPGYGGYNPQVRPNQPNPQRQQYQPYGAPMGQYGIIHSVFFVLVNAKQKKLKKKNQQK